MIEQKFNIYLHAGIAFAPVVHCSQYSQGETWTFTILDNDGSVYRPSSGALIGVKSDGNVIAGITGTVNADGTVSIVTTQQLTAAAGRGLFELTIDGGTNGTANFIIDVEKKPTDDGILSESDLSIIQQAINSVTPVVINETVSDYLAEHMTNPPIDPTLTVSNAAADAKVTGDEITDLKNAIDPWVYLPIDETHFISGYYVWNDGKLYTGQNYKVSPFIRCAFKRIKINPLTQGGGIQSIAFYADADESTYISGYENTEALSSFPVYEMDVPTNAKYIRITKNKVSSYTANVVPYVMLRETSESILERVDNANDTAQNALDEIENLSPQEVLRDVYRTVKSDVNLIPSDGLLLHSYLNNSGEIKTVTNPNVADYAKCVSGYIPVIPGEILYLSGDTFLTSQFYGWYDNSKTYLGGNNLTGAMTVFAHVASVTVPNNANYLRITFHTETDASVSWAGYTGTIPAGVVINATNEEYLDYHYFPTNPCDFIGRDVCTFNKILCIGDSITAGYFNHSGGGQTIAKYSYPVHLEKITGVECVNMGDAGETSVSWWQTYQNTDFAGYDCAIINLGINDALLSVTEEDTRTAFTSIINALKTANAGIKIFIANIIPAYARGNTTYDAINAIIEDIATNNENCYFIDLTQYGHAVGVAYANGHLTAVGYWMLAEDYANAISYIIRNNPEAFRFIQFIGTDLHN